MLLRGIWGTSRGETIPSERGSAVLDVGLCVLGLGLCPLLKGPISTIYGRKVIYRTSFNLFFIFTFLVAFAPHTRIYVSYVTSCMKFVLKLLE